MTEWTKSELKAVGARLRKRLTELSAQGDRTRSDRAPVELDQSRVGRLSRMDALQIQAMATETQRRREAEAGRIAAALERLTAGDYGYCVRCEAPIPRKRLDLDPAVPTCVSCAT